MKSLITKLLALFIFSALTAFVLMLSCNSLMPLIKWTVTEPSYGQYFAFVWLIRSTRFCFLSWKDEAESSEEAK